MIRTLCSLLLCLTSVSVMAASESEQGEQLFQSRCALCHALPEPDMLNASQWRVVLGTMQKRMQQAGMSPLSGEELERVFVHLTRGE